MPSLPPRPAGAIDKRHLIPKIQAWPEYAGKEQVVDAYFIPGDSELKVVTFTPDGRTGEVKD